MDALNVVNKIDISFFNKVYFLFRYCMLPLSRINELLPKSGVILDLGCGIGPLSLFLVTASQGRKVVGWDIDKSRIKIAKKISANVLNVNFEARDAEEEIKIPNLRGVVASDFFHHLNFSSQETVIRNVSEKLHKDGVFIIKDIDKSDTVRYWCSSFWDKIFYPKDKIYFRTKDEWTKLLSKYNFKVKVEKKVKWFPGSTTLFICRKQ